MQDASFTFSLGPWDLDPNRHIPPLTVIGPGRCRRLRSQLKLACPRKPGVYGMLDEHGELIYVGKAKSLRTRLFSYFRSGRTRKVGRLMQQTRRIVWEICGSEFAALHRELELIRRWRPRWNVQGQPLRKRLTWLCLGRGPAAYVFLTRRPGRCQVFAPLPLYFRSREAVRWVNDFFKLRDCSQEQAMIFSEQAGLYDLQKPAGCLRFEIGTCLGPCTGTCSRADYRKHVDGARAFLEGRTRAPFETLEQALQQAAAVQQYERAAVLRDRLEVLRWLTERLERFRHDRQELSFVYEVTGWDRAVWWFVIHGGRTLAALRRPEDTASAALAKRLLQKCFQETDNLLSCAEHIDSMLVASSWFRKRPGEKVKTLSLKDASALLANVEP